MPRIKIEILGSKIEINYQENEYSKLLYLIENFKKRLNNFKNDGRISTNTILVLSALKAEDELEDFKEFFENNKLNEEIVEKKNIIIEQLNKEISLLTNKLNQSFEEEKKLVNNNEKIIKEIDKLKNEIDLIYLKLKDFI